MTRPAGLTAREVEVLRLLAQGLSGKQIAARLVISPKTARNHIEHIYAKTGLSSRAQVSLFAMQHGLLPADEYVTRRWGICPTRLMGPRSYGRRYSDPTGGLHDHPHPHLRLHL